MPNEPAESDFKHEGEGDRLSDASSATAWSGPTWARARRRRHCRTSKATCCRRTEWEVSAVQRECNWLQGLEGDIDTSHVSFLHSGDARLSDTARRYVRVLHRNTTGAAVRRGDTTVARCTAPIGRRRRAATTGALRTSCSRPDVDATRRARLHVRGKSGCRWTTSTRCTSLCCPRSARQARAMPPSSSVVAPVTSSRCTTPVGSVASSWRSTRRTTTVSTARCSAAVRNITGLRGVQLQDQMITES